MAQRTRIPAALTQAENFAFMLSIKKFILIGCLIGIWILGGMMFGSFIRSMVLGFIAMGTFVVPFTVWFVFWSHDGRDTEEWLIDRIIASRRPQRLTLVNDEIDGEDVADVRWAFESVRG